jgi:hypothetical protein
MPKISEREYKVCVELLKLFKFEEKTAADIVTEGELEIFHAIVFRKWDRVQILCSTQYGKSLFVALACIIVSCIQGELIAVIAPKEEQAKIIMRYYIQHLGDNLLFYSQLEKNTKLERLVMEESKDRIILRNHGGIYALSAQAGNSQKGILAAMGEGASNVIADEASLIPDNIEATIFRMIAGKGEKAFYCKIGNPFYRNHFLKSWNSPIYHKIFIDYKQGVSEGRYTQKFIEEAKKKPHFDILFECKFPEADLIDEKGYIRLYPDELVDKAQRVVEPFGEKRLGLDVAEGGGDYNTFVLRWPNYAMTVFKARIENTMETTGHIIQAAKEYEVFDHNWFLDNLGVGKGIYDRLIEQRYSPFPVRYSEKAHEETQFINLKAELYWALYKWLSEGGCLEPSVEWEQLKWIKYKVDSSGRIQIQPKDELRKEGYPSPDTVDALANTFARKSVVNKSKEERLREKEVLKNFDFYKDSKQKYLSGSKYLR